jgi:hypothetical protein
VSLRREREHVVVEMARLHVVNFSVEPDICVLLQHCRPDFSHKWFAVCLQHIVIDYYNATV